MKRTFSLAFAVLLLISLCACGARRQAEPTQPTGGEYQQLIEKLEAGDYDGARAMIDELEGTQATEPAEEKTTAPTEAAAVPEAPGVTETQPEETQRPAGTEVHLDDQNAKDYFEVFVGYSYGPTPSFSQSLVLKEEYAQRVAALEDVRITVSYFLSDAYGQLDEKDKNFLPEHYEIVSKREVTMEIPVSDLGMVNFIQGVYDRKNGCFPDFPVDVKITDATGTMILTQ